MKKAGDLLEKFKNLAKNQPAMVVAAAREVLLEDFSIKIPAAAVSARGRIVRIKTAGPVRAEIITQEDKIIKKINERLGGEYVSGIK